MNLDYAELEHKSWEGRWSEKNKEGEKELS